MYYVYRDSWELIVESTSNEFQAQKASNSFEYGTCLAWFYDSFYERLFSVCPSSIPLFKGDLQVQGRALVSMISTCLEQITSNEAFKSTMEKLAKAHAQKGIIVNEYFIVGDVLLWTLEKCLGIQFDNTVKNVWCRIYSMMLQEIVPVAVVEEVKYAVNVKNVPY